MRISRRDFLHGLVGISGASLIGNDLPAPESSGIEHIVLVMMENRSFDHFLGWLPGARGMQEGLTYIDGGGMPHATYHLEGDFKGCGHPDPDHSYDGGREQYDVGAMDGFLRSGNNDVYSIGYYIESDLPFLSALARHYTTFDAYFCSILGPTFPNRIFQHAAQTDRLSNTFDIASVPTIWDTLASAGVSARYYYSNVPFLALWGLKYRSIAASYRQFLRDAAAGTLPAVSFLDPRFTIGAGRNANDDHPHADIRRGDAFLSNTFRALARGPAWSSTVLIVTRDEWGGFFDHVPPPRAAAPNDVDPDVVDGKSLLGFRIPVVIASPWTRGNPLVPRIGRATFDHTSALKLIEWRFGLPPLTARDASDDVGNPAHLFQWTRPDARVPRLPHPMAPRPMSCSTTEAPSDALSDAWSRLVEYGITEGWPVFP